MRGAVDVSPDGEEDELVDSTNAFREAVDAFVEPAGELLDCTNADGFVLDAEAAACEAEGTAAGSLVEALGAL